MTRLPRAGWMPVAVLATCGVLGWATGASADPIRIGVATPDPSGQPSAGSLTDTNGDGAADSGSYYMTVFEGGGGFEARGYAEYDVSALSGSTIQHAWFQAPYENGFYDSSKQISVRMYNANGRFDLSDYSIAANPLGVVFISADTGSGTGQIYFDVTAALQGLLAGGSHYAGLRFDPVGGMDPITIGGHAGESAFLYVDATGSQTPEPASLLLLGTGAGLMALKRRRKTMVA